MVVLVGGVTGGQARPGRSWPGVPAGPCVVSDAGAPPLLSGDSTGDSRDREVATTHSLAVV